MRKRSMLFRSLVLVVIVFMAFMALGGCTGKEQTTGPDVVEDFPTKTINIVVPWPPGGRTDTYIRGLAPLVEEYTGVPVIVSNHAGASSVLGARAVLSAGADGYTLLALSGGTMAYKVARTPALEVDKFAAVTTYVHQPYFIVVNSNSPFQTLDDLVAYAKENPGVTTFGDTGVAVDDDLYIREMMDQLGIEMNLIPYPGDSPLITEILAGELDAGICVITGLKAHVDSGAFRLLAVGSEERHPDYADVPTLKELGVDLVADYFGMLAAPEGTPEEVLDILDEAFGKAINDPRFQQMMNDLNSSGVYWDRHKTKEVMDFTIERDVERATKFGLNM